MANVIGVVFTGPNRGQTYEVDQKPPMTREQTIKQLIGEVPHTQTASQFWRDRSAMIRAQQLHPAGKGLPRA